MGAGRTGKAAANFLREKGKNFLIYDDKVEKMDDYPMVKMDQINWENIEMIVMSPGILNWPTLHPVIEKARAYPIAIFSDMDILYHNNPSAYFLGVTGSQGKSTIHDFLYKLLKIKEEQWEMGGNNGIPVLSLPQKKSNYLLEISMQQSYITQSLLFDMVIITNFFDTHHEFGNYYHRLAAKFKQLQRANFKLQNFIIGDFPKGLVEKLGNDVDMEKTIVVISHKEHSMEDYNKWKNCLYIGQEEASYYFQYKIHGEEEKIAISSSLIYNLIAIENCAFAFIAAKLLGVQLGEFMETLSNYTIIKNRITLEHTFYDANGTQVRYFNCSKCTNTQGLYVTSQYIQNKIEDKSRSSSNIFLIGGVLNSPIENLINPFILRGDSIYLYGASKEEISKFLQENHFPQDKIFLLTNMKEATKMAREKAEQRGVNLDVFLIPCCPSFDEFKDFEERGKVFAELVSL